MPFPERTVDFQGVVPPAHAGPDDLATGTDVIISRSGSTVTLPAGRTCKTSSGWSVLTQDASGTPHVLRAAAGTYTWKIGAHPRDGQGPDLALTGTMTLGRPPGRTPVPPVA
ncbi:hypothetical protein [Streptomyces griseochromogenes]|uniref:hypothetical protein n=1 Tax=Streptomyces griseochromogenes TaxID=68214 RepID=UPI00379DBB95